MRIFDSRKIFNKFKVTIRERIRQKHKYTERKWMSRAVRNTKFIVVGLIIFLCIESIGHPISVGAQDMVQMNKRVVFLLDTSGSMKTNDPDQLAIDSIAQLIYSLPSNYEIGFVAYNSKVIAKKSCVTDGKRKSIMEKAQKVEYAGYSNAGTGLMEAVKLLNDDTDRDKSIVMLTDGEILMENDSATQKSEKLYQKGIKLAADKNIQVHVIGLGDDMKNRNNVMFSAAQGTKGNIYYAPQARKIQDAIDAILSDVLAVKQTTLASAETNGRSETITTDIPYTQADMVRVLLTGTAAISNVSAKFCADSAEQIKGERYVLIKIKHPTDTQLDLSFKGIKGEHIRICVIPEYRVLMKANITYNDKLPEDTDEQPRYQREATIRYTFWNMENEDALLWKEKFFTHAQISLGVNGKLKEFFLKDGCIEDTVGVRTEEKINVQPDYSKLPVNVIESNCVDINLQEPPIIPKPERHLEDIYKIVLIGGILILICGFVFGWKRHKPKIHESGEDKPEPSKYSYVGRMNIYITNSVSQEEFAPLTFNLFRLPAGKVISLKDILESCGVEQEFTGAQHIYFKPGTNRRLILTNNSDCTIMKNREILLKKKSYEVVLDSKVDIVFEDEIGELTFQYKELKPSVI